MRKLRSALALAALLAAPAALGVGLQTSGIPSDTPAPPPPPVVSCTLTENDITVTSFADILGYQIKGPCKVTFPGTSLKPQTSTYEGGGSWTSATGAVNEFVKGRDAKGQPWEIRGSGNCRLDPWMVGPAAAGCNGTVASATPNAPDKFFKSMAVPVSAGVLDQQARGWLTGKALKAIAAEHQAPVILKPAEGETSSAPVEMIIQPGSGSPTKTFALEWQVFLNGAWSPANVTDQMPLDGKIPLSSFGGNAQFRVRARAHQSKNAKWSDWRGFKVPWLPPPPPPNCPNAAAYGATYDVTAMPASLKAGATGLKVSIKVTNGSNQNWPVPSNYHLSYHWVGGPAPVYDGERTSLPAAIPPCGSAVFSANVKAPAAAGAYQIQWDMVLEGTAWFSAQGVATGNKAVTVTP